MPRLRVTALCAGLLLAAGCGGTPAAPAAPAAGVNTPTAGGFPVTVRAANGLVRIPARPTAIVSLSPTATEMVYAIGAGGQVKAVDSLSDYPPQAPRTSLSAFNPNVEAIVAEKPDLVLEAGDTAGLTHALAFFHIPVLSLPAANDLTDVYQQIDEIGAATGHLPQAELEAAGIRRQIAQIVASVRRPAHPYTYYYELEQDYYSVTSSTFIGQLLSLLGLRSIADAARGAAASGGYPQLSAEFVLQQNPDYLLLADTLCCGQSARTVAARPGWSALTAVRDGHVVPLNDDIASRWGPRIVDLLQTVARAVYGSG